MRGWVCPSPWECVSICFYVSVFKRLCLFYVAKGGRVRIQYSFRIFVCQLMPNKYHVLKKVQGTWTPIFFSCSFYWLKRRGITWSKWAHDVWQVNFSRHLLSPACFEVFRILVLECDRAEYIYSLAYIPGTELFAFIEFVSALGEKNHQEFHLIKKWYQSRYM